MNNSTKDLCLTGLMIALVCVCTMFISIPIGSSGYVHLGDSMVIFAGVVFGRKKGLLAGGIGSMFADIFLGYTAWAPFTLVVKGTMGFVAGAVAHNPKNLDKNFINAKRIIAGLLCVVVLVGGYFLSTAVLVDFPEAMASIPANALQGVMGFVLYIVVGMGFFRTGLQNTLLPTANATSDSCEN